MRPYPWNRAAASDIQPSRSAGFTLVEAAVTLAIVAIVLVTILKGMEGAKLTSFHTKQKKVAYELGTGLLGEVAVGLWREELESGMSGSFAEQDQPDFYWELALGEEVFEETDDEDRPFDNFAARRDWEERNRSETEEEELEDDEEIEEPFEKLRVRVTFPKIKDFTNELVLEAWVPWEEVYGPSEEEEGEEALPDDPNSTDGGGAGGQGNSGINEGITADSNGNVTRGG